MARMKATKMETETTYLWQAWSWLRSYWTD